jgi:hypothetical protein
MPTMIGAIIEYNLYATCMSQMSGAQVATAGRLTTQGA